MFLFSILLPLPGWLHRGAGNSVTSTPGTSVPPDASIVTTHMEEFQYYQFAVVGSEVLGSQSSLTQDTEN